MGCKVTHVHHPVNFLSNFYKKYTAVRDNDFTAMATSTRAWKAASARRSARLAMGGEAIFNHPCTFSVEHRDGGA